MEIGMENIEKCDKCGIEMAYEEFVGWWCPSCDTITFGAVEACQLEIGITCDECRYDDDCRGDEDGTR